MEGCNDASWYTDGGGHTPIVTVTDGAAAVTVFCDGKMRVACLTCWGGDDVIRDAEGWARHDIHNDAQVFAASESGHIEWINNPWFDLYDRHGNHLDRVTHSLDDAIEAACDMVRLMLLCGE